MRCGVVTFPGSNCDHDVYHVLKHVLSQQVGFLWHDKADLKGAELVVLPGGFAYGDYLRGGALAALSPILEAVREHADNGGLVLGICNGFQVLLESGLLPGALRRNRSLRFECRDVFVQVERADTPWTEGYEEGRVLRLPIAHGEGNYVASEADLEVLEETGRVVFRYCDTDGNVDEESASNINGSQNAIAGIVSSEGNILGMMPHPERCSEAILGNDDGLALLATAVGAATEVLGLSR
ncbi:MAG: phosphoribosylformylglycinamidine synthase subunit PurQ [Thermoanaerobaculia bacterium]|nr:phosphoribosylformylglycinamidine synthase subunit PurQ [Thermoanaerobaculia bacterium]